jgi:hypothetical protein
VKLLRTIVWRTLLSLATLLPLSLALPATAARAADVFTVYMSASGSDSNDGMTSTTGVYSLVRVQEVLRQHKPGTDVEVRIDYGTYTAPYMHDWRFYVPGHTISFLPTGWNVGDPAPAAGRPIFQNKKNADGTYPDGYWLQPRLPQDTADPLYNGGTSGLRFYYLQIQNYNAGGISIWGDSERDVDDENYDPPMYQQAGAGLNGNTMYGMLFTHLGSKWAGGHYGWGAVVLTNSSNNVMDNNLFINIENGGSYGGYIHGAYITHFSTHNTVTNSKFRLISSDPVKVRDRSNYTTVEHNQFINAGVNSYYRGEFCDRACAVANPGTQRQCAEYHNRFFYNDLVSGYSGAAIPTWSLSPAGLTTAGGSPCSIPAGEQRLNTGGNT